MQDIQTQEVTTVKRAMVRFRGARKKGAMAFVEYLGVSQEDTMEGPLWRETLGGSLRSPDAVELVVGTCHGDGCRQETTLLHAISCTKTRWSSLTHIGCSTRQWLDPFARAKYSLLLIHGPIQERASGKNGRLNPLRTDITTEAGALFDNHPRLKNKALLLDITIVSPRTGSNLGNAARHVGKHLADAVERKENKYQGSFPATYSLLPLAMSSCGEIGSDVHALIKEFAIRRVEHRSETHSNESQHLAEEAEVARLRRGDSLLFYSRDFHSARVTISADRGWPPSTRQLRSQGLVSIQAHRTGGVTGSGGREGANGVGGGIGVGGGNGDSNGNMISHRDGDGAGTGTGAGVEMNKGAQDENGDGAGDL